MLYFAEKLSPNMARSAEGYLICRNVPVARVGVQEYLTGELGLPFSPHRVPVHRLPEEVFSPACIASFEGKPVTEDHPADPEGVTAENIHRLQKGHAQNIRRGEGPDSNLLLADLVITDPGVIRRVLAGKREISCGYTYPLTQENGRWIQREIRGNHIAVVDHGRAGPRVAIRDHRPPCKKERSTHPMKKSVQKTVSPAAASPLIRKLVASAIRGNTDLIDSGKGGFLVASDDAEGFADAIRKILADPGIREQMKRYNLEKIRRYSIESVTEQMARLYESMM